MITVAWEQVVQLLACTDQIDGKRKMSEARQKWSAE